MEWVNKLYSETDKIWKENGKDKNGYSIFYSPVKSEPDILIIGYNPGGDESAFIESEIGVPKEHEYFSEKDGDYRLAKQMKKIFGNADMLDKLRQSVKFNLIFFRSKNIKELSASKELINFCKNKTREIIDKLQPKLILAEGFETYEELLKLTKGNKKTIYQNFPVKDDKQKCISCIGETGDGIKIIGIIHPSGGHGISDEMLTQIGKNIKAELKD